MGDLRVDGAPRHQGHAALQPRARPFDGESRARVRAARRAVPCQSFAAYRRAVQGGRRGSHRRRHDRGDPAAHAPPRHDAAGVLQHLLHRTEGAAVPGSHEADGAGPLPVTGAGLRAVAHRPGPGRRSTQSAARTGRGVDTHAGRPGADKGGPGSGRRVSEGGERDAGGGGEAAERSRGAFRRARAVVDRAAGQARALQRVTARYPGGRNETVQRPRGAEEGGSRAGDAGPGGQGARIVASGCRTVGGAARGGRAAPRVG